MFGVDRVVYELRRGKKREGRQRGEEGKGRERIPERDGHVSCLSPRALLSLACWQTR